jgi:hypothetical protein
LGRSGEFGEIIPNDHAPTPSPVCCEPDSTVCRSASCDYIDFLAIVAVPTDGALPVLSSYRPFSPEAPDSTGQGYSLAAARSLAWENC